MLEYSGNGSARASITERVGRIGTLVVLCSALASCDFEVTNPGPVQDANLDDSGAHEALVTGSKRSTLQGLSWLAHYGGSVARDHTTGGHQQAGGVPLQIELGQLDEQNTAPEGWDGVQQGRWIGENMAVRMREKLGAAADSYSPLGRLHLWAGYANRSLGENFCTAIIDVGEPGPYRVYFERAVEHFTKAAEIAGRTGETAVRMSALVGRANAYMYLGKYSEAAADASLVPLSFVHSEVFPDGERWRTTEALSPSYRGVSYWYHPFEEYFPATGDSRVAWGYDPKNASAPVARGTWGKFVPFYYPLKYYAPRNAATERTVYSTVNQNTMFLVPINISTGREALLIRAEAALVGQDWQGAMTLINTLRANTKNYFTGAPVAPVAAANLDEAWAALKFERLIEFTLEGRRLGDRKRWKDQNRPGALHPLEYIPDNHVQRYGVPREQDLCFPLPRSEKEQNPNIPKPFTG